MAILPILTFPDPILRTKAVTIETVDDSIKRLVDDMAETMYAAPGVGLAANQVGVLKRVFVIDIAGNDEPSDLHVFINPEILALQGLLEWNEGCLSFPGIAENLKRAQLVRVRALNREGKSFELEATDLLAVAIQHENDHLNGRLMIDHLGPVRKRLVQRKLAKNR